MQVAMTNDINLMSLANAGDNPLPKEEEVVLDLGGGDTPPWDEGPTTSGEATDFEEETLEIYKKAERFKKLKLLSGNTIPGDLEDYVDKTYGKLGRQRLLLAKYVMRVMRYNTSPDVMLMLASTKRAKVVIATAGAGKTTSLQVQILIDKMLDKALGTNELVPELVEGTAVTMPRILYLNYNKHNVKPIEDRHTAVVAALNKTLKPADRIDDSIESSTVHAFCHKWLTAFSHDIELPELQVISDEDKTKVWTAIITPRWKKFYGDNQVCNVEYTVLDELYTYKVESMLDWDEFFNTAKFIDSELKEEFVKSCIKKYDSMKRQMKLMDFTDYLVWTIETLQKYPEFKRKLQERYRLIIADENQDFTRLMNELLLELYDPDVNRLVVVGDPDQTLYEFKGVSPDNVVNLMERLREAELLGLDTNYRCPDKIVEGAKKILDLNVLRFEKPINTVRTGGEFICHPLAISSSEEQSRQVIQLLKRMGSSEWSHTVIAYRNNQSSVFIGEELFYEGIPFKILDDRRPFNNNVFRQLNQAIKALKEKDNFELNKLLYRFMPVTRGDWEKVLELNRQARRNHLHDLLIPYSELPKGTAEAMRSLIRISEVVDSAAVCDYIGRLVELYRLYYFNFMLQSANPIAPEKSMDAMYLERALKFFNRQLTWDYMQKELVERNVDSEFGVTLSTFHGLKGLEFDHVIAIDFSESLFPNFASIEQKYKPNTAIAEKEAENRLCYVLVTRAIKNMHMFYPESDPSIYVSILTKDNAVSKPSSDISNLDLGAATSPSTVMTSKADFLSKLLNGRR